MRTVPHHAIGDADQIQALLDAVVSIESDLDLSNVLRRITEAACTLTSARYGALGVIDPEGTGLSDFIPVGVAADTIGRIGDPPVGEGILGVLILDPRPLRMTDLTAHPDAGGFPPGHPPMRSFLGVPLLVRGEVFGNLYLADKRGSDRFTEEDEALVVALAVAAGIAINTSRMHIRLAELGLAAERERIARDLHDTVIQRLFATGLSLQALLPGVVDPEVRARIEDAVSNLDDTITQVRTTIFALEPPPEVEAGVRLRVLRICAEAAEGMDFVPEVRFVGAVDRYVTPVVATELLPTLREALSNVVRHSGAGRAEVELSVGDRIQLRVTDDGIGPDPRPDASGHRGRGLANMADRAVSLGGALSVTARSPSGTDLVWEVPLRTE
jgi:signal transduction histidine kinase